jgi:hypothetical protein
MIATGLDFINKGIFFCMEPYFFDISLEVLLLLANMRALNVTDEASE